MPRPTTATRTERRRRRPPAWLLTLGVGGLLAVAYPLQTLLAADAVYLGVGVGAVMAVVVGLRRHRPADPRPWTLFGVGLALLVTGDVIYVAATVLNDAEPAFPHAADAVYLLGMLSLATGGVMMAWLRHRAASRRVLLDSGIITLAGGLVLWLLVGSTIVRTPDVTWLVGVVSLAYPLFDTALLGILVALSFGGRATTGATRLLIAAFAVQVVTDTLYATAAADGTYVGGEMLDTGWLLAYVLIAAAAMHPSMVRATQPTTPRLIELSLRHLVVMTLPLVIAGSAVLAVGHRHAESDPGRFLLDLTVAVPIGIIAIVLLLLRVASVTNELARTTRERDAARHRELVLADIVARLARSDEVAQVRAIVATVSEAIVGHDADVQLVLPDDGATPRAREPDRRGQAVTTVHLTDQPDDGAIVVRGDIAITDDERQVFERLASDVVMALDRCRLSWELRANEQRFRSLVRHAPDAITVHDADGNVTYVSPALGHILGVDQERLHDLHWHDLLHPDDRSTVADTLAQVVATPSETRVVEARLEHADGSWRWVEARFTNLLGDPSVEGIVTNHRDITEQQRLQRQLEHQATHDPLTGVANRRRFAEAVHQGEAASGSHAVIYLDLDRFKEINDRLGHSAGDEVLRTIADRLRQATRPGDLVARLGGDEFAVLLRDATDDEAAASAERLLAAVQHPVEVGGEVVAVEASAGLSTTGRDGATSDLLHDADMAMYMAKAGGRGRVERATPEVRERTAERLAFEADLRSALQGGNLSLTYRPVVDLASGGTAEMQAEINWTHHVRGRVPPHEFLPVAGRIGVLDVLATWAFNEACWSARTWIDVQPDLRVCVPFPGVALREPSLADALTASLAATGLDGRHMVLQIAGSTLLDHPPATESIERLRAAGVHIRVTDFGTNTPMRVVRDAPVDELLLSAPLVAGLTAGPEAAALGRAVLLLAESFALEVVAEGISSAEQVDELVARGAKRGSGEYLGRLVAASDVSATLLAARHTLGAPPG